jgi:hypothetical protein
MQKLLLKLVTRTRGFKQLPLQRRCFRRQLSNLENRSQQHSTSIKLLDESVIVAHELACCW